MAKLYDHDVFREERELLEEKLRDNEAEKRHIERCESLAESINWDSCDAGSEFREMLGSESVDSFNEVLRRCRERTAEQTALELRDPAKLLALVMHVHDLGKSKEARGHEKLSAQIVRDKSGGLGWSPIGVHLLYELVLNHGLMGITRTGEASITFLTPILRSVSGLTTDTGPFFLDLLFLLTCCDSGATADPNTGVWYLDDSRVKLYYEVVEDMLTASREGNWFSALLERAADLEHTAIRVSRIVTSGNRALTASDGDILAALQKAVDQGHLHLENFARTRFDHGFYVFEPILWDLSEPIEARQELSADSLGKFLLLLGILSGGNGWLWVVSLRNSFSGRYCQNKDRLQELCKAVRTGQVHEIRRVVDNALWQTWE